MITFRSFRNSDPPQIAEIWRSQPASRGLVQPMSSAIFERHALNSLLFDRDALIVACDQKRLLGFVHAGFGPMADESRLATDIGGTLALMVRPAEAKSSLADELLLHSERYLQHRGAKVLTAGGVDRLGPFYLGLIGGTASSALLDSDPREQQFYLRHDYREESRSLVLQCDLGRFRAPVDRRQLQAKRRTQFEVILDPPSASWWEANTTSNIDRARFDLISKENGTCLASVRMWAMELLGATWGMRAAGLLGLEVLLDCNKRQGLAMLLVAEAMRYLQSMGIKLIEVQVTAGNLPARTLFERLGFSEVDQAVRYRKVVANDAT